MASRFAIPAAMRHPVALAGAAIATVMALLFLVLFLLDTLGWFDNPYVGLLLFVAIPALLLVGLGLIPIGAALDRRRRRRNPNGLPAAWPVIDLGIARQRRIVLGVLGLTAVNLVLVSLASYGAVHAMETTSFCGLVCHATMEPEFVAHRNGPHARVACVACHVGPGAGALVASKMSGTRQLWQIVTHNVPTPVPSPVRHMRPARDTCGQCHSPETPRGDRLRVIREYGDDRQDTETVTRLTMHVGGGNRAVAAGNGIHWHANPDNEIDYVAADAKREVIPVVRLRTRGGVVREYVLDGATPAQLTDGSTRRMDCLDCHNQPAHTMAATPERAVDDAIAQGGLPGGLPFIRREAVALLRPVYADRAAGLRLIAAGLHDRYRGEASVDPAQVEQAVAGLQAVWSRNVFPAMKVTWGTYPNHLGHVDSNGCFRCHDDNHKSKDGAAIRQDCELCHTQS